MANTRDFKSLGVWAENAETTIPALPQTGIPYRNTALSEAQNEDGEAYDTIPDSANFNQKMYIITSFIDLIDSHGVPGWSNLVDYDPLPAPTWGDDGVNRKFYQAIQVSGPNTAAGVRDPVSEPDYWEELVSSITVVADLSSTTPGDEGARQVGTNFIVDGNPAVPQTVQDTLDFNNHRAFQLQGLRLVFAADFLADGTVSGQSYNILNNKADIITSAGFTYYRFDLIDRRFYSIGMMVKVTPLRTLDTSSPSFSTSLLTSNYFTIIGPWESENPPPIIDLTNTIKIYFTNPFNINQVSNGPFSAVGFVLDTSAAPTPTP